MNNDELKEALENRRPVIYKSLMKDEIEYLRVSAIIYRMNKRGKLKVSAELLDRNENSVVIVEPALIRYAELKQYS